MNRLKRSAALILAVIIVFVAMPVSAFASLLENSAEYNAEILAALQEVVGSENEAKEYYKVMEKYGLFDEDGNMVDNLTATIDGVEYDNDQLRELLSGDYDGSKIAMIDGMPISLDNLWNIIVIEGYIDYLREQYCLDGEWTQENEDSYNSFLTQVNTLGVNLAVDKNSSLTGEYSGINHGAIVSFTASAPSNNVVTVTAKLSAANSGQQVSFNYETISGSAKVNTAKGTVNMTAASNGTATATFKVTLVAESLDDMASENPIWYLNVSNLKNALFAESGRNAATIPFSGLANVGSNKELSGFVGEFTCTCPLYSSSSSYSILPMTDPQKYAIRKGYITKVSDTLLEKNPMMLQWFPNAVGLNSNINTVTVNYTLKLEGIEFLQNSASLRVYSSHSPSGSVCYQADARAKWTFNKTKQLSATFNPPSNPSSRIEIKTSF
ncbi:MAG: hypothetical protein Q4E99_03920 [Bacillota bacterium]|nr:hypothetical protein [Bacillota bacterium]